MNTYKIGDTFWLDSQGIGINTPLSYFAWDFAEFAEIVNIENDKITIAINKSLPHEILIILNSEMLDKIITIC